MDITTLLLQIDVFAKQLETTAITTIERDLIKSKLLTLYEKVSLSTTTQTPISPIIDQPTTLLAEVPKVEVAAIAVEEIVLPKVEEPASTATEKVVEPTIVTPPVATPIPEVQKVAVHETPPPVLKKESSLVDRLNETDNSLMGKFTTTSKGLNDNVTEGDLKKLIDFNRQFVFIQELFGNDPKAYMEAINQLNSISTIEEAVKYINQELVPKYNWSKDLQSLKLFDKIIRQKFGI